MNIKRKIFQYDKDTGDFIKMYESIAEAASEIDCDESTLRKCANGVRPSAMGYLWSFIKRDSYIEVDEANSFALSRGINPNQITRTKITHDSRGNERISIETKRPHVLTDEQKQAEFVQSKAKQLQRKQDENRILKKEFREYARVENALTALSEEMVKHLQKAEFKPYTKSHPVEEESNVLIVQITDWHLNELVEMPDNEYGFVVGSKRAQKFAERIKKIAEVYNATEIVVAMTGDFINSDRRLDEILTAATNRTKASLIATQIIYYFLQDINQVANLSVMCVSGNESRVKDEFSLGEQMMSDNYDFLIFNMLKMMFRDSKGVRFIDGDPVEQVINVNNSNVLITHGTTIKEGQAAMQQVFGKYAAKGILLDYAIYGHIHFTNVTDIYSRSGSLVGNSIYSDRHLNLVTKASQIVHVINADGNIDNIKVGLQHVDNYPGYDIKDDLKAYNSKFADNMKQRTTIVKVVI